MSPDGTPARGPRIGAFIRTEAGVSDILGMALFALRGNWLRSTLTSLGVIIGIAAVIVMVSVGQGTQNEIDKMVSGLGANRLDINSGASRSGGACGLPLTHGFCRHPAPGSASIWSS